MGTTCVTSPEAILGSVAPPTRRGVCFYPSRVIKIVYLPEEIISRRKGGELGGRDDVLPQGLGQLGAGLDRA